MRTILFPAFVMALAFISCPVMGQTQIESPTGQLEGDAESQPNQVEGKAETPSIQVDGKTVKFQSMEHGKLHFEGGVDRDFHDVEVETQKKIMDYTGWGRTWEADDGKHLIADLIRVADHTVVLETIDGKQHSVEISRLSNLDRDYVEARHGTTEESLPEWFVAKVVGVHDGDTLTVLLNKRQYKIRIDGIDAPELGQDFGKRAKQHLSNLAMDKMVTGTCVETDRYGRNICTLKTVRGIEVVNNAMVEAGMAWHYTKYSDDETLIQLELEAREAKLGLWAGDNPVPPWDWRKWGADDRKDWADKQLESEISPRLAAEIQRKAELEAEIQRRVAAEIQRQAELEAENLRKAKELSLAQNRRRADDLKLAKLKRRAAELSEELAHELEIFKIRRRAVESWESWVARLEAELAAKRKEAELAAKRRLTEYSRATYTRSRTIHRGPRGGRYYYNSNGNKTYVK